MQRIRPGAALLASLTLLAPALTGCSKNPGGATSGGGGAVPLTGTDAVATVNGQSISQSQFYTDLQAWVPNPSNVAMAPVGQAAGRLVLQQMIRNLLIEGLAKEQGVAPTDAEVEAQYKDYEMEQNFTSLKPLTQALADAGLSPDDFKEMQIRPQLAQLKLLAKGITVSDADVKAYYDVNKAKQFTKPDRAHIKRIALSDQADAQSIYGEIKKGKPFENFVSRSVAKLPADGDIQQWVPLDDTSNPAIAPLIKSIKATKPGDTASPFFFQNMWWLVKVVEKKDKVVQPLDQVKGLIQNTLLAQKAQQNPNAETNFDQQLRDYQAKAKIDIKGPQYAQLQDQLRNPAPLPSPVGLPGGAGGPAPSAGAPAPHAAAPAPAAPKGKP